MRIRNLIFVLFAVIVSGCNKGKMPDWKEPALQPIQIVGLTNEDAVVAEPVPVAEEAVEIQPLINDGKWVATASSQEAQFVAPMAIDGFMATRWSSEFKDNQWWMVDFGREEQLARINLNWETAYTKNYRILLSTNQTDWVEVFAESNSQGGAVSVTFTPQLARFVKIECLQRATQWGNSLFEIQFNEKGGGKAEQNEMEGEMEASSSSGVDDYAPKFALDGKMDTRWSSNFGDSEWWQVKFAAPRVIGGLKISWETAFAEKYEIAVSMDGEKWQKIYDVPDGDGRTDLIFFKPVETRFVRIQCLQRGTGWGNSIYEIAFYGDDRVPVVTASSAAANADPGLAVDGDPATAWHSDGDGEQSVTVKLPEKTSLGGMEMLWGNDYATAYSVECSVDGGAWSPVFSEQSGNGAKDYIFFPASEAQYVRIVCQKSSSGNGYAIAQLEFKSGEEQASPIRAYQAKARDAARGRYLMWLTREQEFWTVVGLPTTNRKR